MVKHTLAAVLMAATAVAATPPVRTMYNDAMAKETAVRKTLAEPQVTDTVLKAVRETIAGYEAVVRRYPGSGYSDNALWQAGRLAIDAYARFKQPADRDAAARLLKRLADGYPSSSLAKDVPAQLSRLDAPDTIPVAPDTVVSSPGPTLPAPAVPAAPAAPREAAVRTSIATIKSVRRSVLPDAVRLVIELDAEVSFHQERIADPSRVFLDLPGTRAAASLIDQTMRFEGDADIVRQVRFGRHPNNTTRVVLDAVGVSSYSVYPLYDPYRLVIDCVRERATAVATIAATPRAAAPKPPVAANAPPAHREPAPLAAKPATGTLLRSAPTNSPQHGVLIADTHEPAIPSEPEPKAVAVAPPMAKPPEAPAPASVVPPAAKNTTGGLSIARQLGLGVSRIVIDPGHGGHDPGAKGKGVVEAELVLDVALRLEKLLQKVQGMEVLLTRRGDDFIELPERTAMANREGADLFLSIHANASNSVQAHGVETYFLNFATNLSAAAVAARENATSTQAMGQLPDFVKAIAMNNKLDESRDLATHVQHAMVERLRPANKTLRDLGVKQAPFVVLIGAVMPSVLAEISFVTNPQEARLLKSNAYRQKIAEALFAAIRKYQTSLKTTTTVATQR